VAVVYEARRRLVFEGGQIFHFFEIELVVVASRLFGKGKLLDTCELLIGERNVGFGDRFGLERGQRCGYRSDAIDLILQAPGFAFAAQRRALALGLLLALLRTLLARRVGRALLLLTPTPLAMPPTRAGAARRPVFARRLRGLSVGLAARALGCAIGLTGRSFAW
jgi:hypothetical protein